MSRSKRNKKQYSEDRFYVERLAFTDVEQLVQIVRQLEQPESIEDEYTKLLLEGQRDKLFNDLRKTIGIKEINKYLDPDSEVGREDYIRVWQKREYCEALKERWGPFHEFAKREDKKLVAKELVALARLYDKPTILEVGCGCGHFLWVLRKYAKRLVGTDNSTHMLYLAKEMFAEQGIHNVGFRHGTCWQLPFARNSFDIVFQIDVCMHVGGTWDSIKEMLRVARRAVFFTGPSFEYDLKRMNKKKELSSLSWAVNQPQLEYKLLEWSERHKGEVRRFYYKGRQFSSAYRHKILVLEKTAKKERWKQFKIENLKPPIKKKKKRRKVHIVDDIGILCSGKSLGRLPEIADKFDKCFIINLWQREGPLVGKYVEGKDITYMLNADQRPWIEAALGGMKPDKAMLAWTRRMMRPDIRKRDVSSIINGFRNVFDEVKFLPIKYTDVAMKIRNGGVVCVHYVSAEFNPKRIWIAGLDFYCCEYFDKSYHPAGLSEHHKGKVARGWTDKLVRFFIRDSVKRFPEIQYKIVTEYKKLPKLPNLEIL